MSTVKSGAWGRFNQERERQRRPQSNRDANQDTRGIPDGIEAPLTHAESYARESTRPRTIAQADCTHVLAPGSAVPMPGLVVGESLPYHAVIAAAGRGGWNPTTNERARSRRRTHAPSAAGDSRTNRKTVPRRPVRESTSVLGRVQSWRKAVSLDGQNVATPSTAAPSRERRYSDCVRPAPRRPTR